MVASPFGNLVGSVFQFPLAALGVSRPLSWPTDDQWLNRLFNDASIFDRLTDYLSIGGQSSFEWSDDPGGPRDSPEDGSGRTSPYLSGIRQRTNETALGSEVAER